MQTNSVYQTKATTLKAADIGIETKIQKVKNATEEVRRLYVVEDTLLGEGAFAKVFRAHSKDDESAKFAIKIMPTKNFSDKIRNQVESEIAILSKLDHAYVIKYANCFYDDRYLYMIMKYIEGRDVFEWMTKNNITHENEIADLVYKIF